MFTVSHLRHCSICIQGKSITDMSLALFLSKREGRGVSVAEWFVCFRYHRNKAFQDHEIHLHLRYANSAAGLGYRQDLL